MNNIKLMSKRELIKEIDIIEFRQDGLGILEKDIKLYNKLKRELIIKG